jgi:PAS domain S-box-containing protein
METLQGQFRAERDRLRVTLDHVAASIVQVGMDARIIEANVRTAEKLGIGLERLAGMHFMSLVHPDDVVKHQASWAALVTGRLERYAVECRYVDASGRVIETETVVSAVRLPEHSYAIATVQDLTEMKRLELDLRLSQKLESVGRLAAGIAHEINTPIQFIGDNTQFLRAAFEDLIRLSRTYRDWLLAHSADPAIRDRVEALDREVDVDYLVTEVPLALDATADGVSRVSTIVRAMKAFAHPDTATPVAAELNSALQSTLTVARNEIKYVADVVTDLGDLPPVLCHLGDVNQVFLNLVVNAAQAMADVQARTGARGTLRVSTRCDGDRVVVAIADTGTGIAPENRQRIFDQFFTTKGVGKGTGQGLAMARAVVERHGGTITFDTTVGAGTTFYVRLPVGGPAGANAA